MSLLYTLSIWGYSLLIALVAPFHRKARLLHRGRQGLIRRIQQQMEVIRERTTSSGTTAAEVIWVHCASLGEFEQGRPVIEALRAKYPEGTPAYRPIVLTFFSPSGYEIRKNYLGVDAVFYLPADTPRNARRFVAAVQPSLALFVKYEYWYNYLSALNKQHIPAHVISALFRPDMVFFRRGPGARFMRKVLGLLDHFFVQNETSASLLKSIGIASDRVTVSGDTRFDRVVSLAQTAPELPFVEAFSQGAFTLVCGSTWPPDEEMLLALMAERGGLKIILAPHEIDSQRIDRFIARSGRTALRYTQLTPACAEELASATLLVVDTIGLLSGVYRYGQAAYIGGGFGRGIHNILEAATWGMPILFGPAFGSFAEAVELVELGAAQSVVDARQLGDAMTVLMDDPAQGAEKGAVAGKYVRRQAGATARILEWIAS